MNRTILILSATILVLAFGQAAADIRCGNDLISPGDSSFDVTIKLEKCGEVMSKEVIRKETTTKKEYDSGKGITKIEAEKMIERWYIRVQERGGKYCYPLTFEEGMLKEIGSWKQCE